MVHIDVDKMRNTLQVAEKGQLFPKIVFEEDKRIQGTAGAGMDSTFYRENKTDLMRIQGSHGEPPDSSGTKYHAGSYT